MLLSRPATLLCDACGAEDKDLFYHCPPCHYGIHKRCAMLPSTTLHDIHSHPLTLSFIGLPTQYRAKFSFFCDICEKWLSTSTNGFWVYYCELCRYFVHIRCMATKKPQIEVDFTSLLIDDLPHLPMTDISVQLIQRYLLENNNVPSIHQDISVLGHKHSLIYSNDQIIEDENEGKEDIVCDACIEPILSPPYYHCAKCRYFLHLTCANLQAQLQHPNHPHQLVLSSKTRFDEVINCDFCGFRSNGFFFHCTTKGCNFNLHLKCAALPEIIKHEYHNHPLFQMYHPSFESCRSCNKWDARTNVVYGCKNCKFYLDITCVLLPKTTKHRVDSKQPLTLRYPPHAYHPKPFDCYECEEEINPNYWLYHCEECDLSFHVDCADSFRLMKYGHKLQIGAHPHPLKFVYEASVRSSRCHNCGTNGYYYSFYTCECETCNFRLCRDCLKDFI